MNKSVRYVVTIAAAQLAACSAGADNSANGPVEQTNVSQTSPVEQPVPQQQERLVLALGDSLYAGYGLDRSQAFPAALERELEAAGIPANVVNAGVSGDTTAGGLRRLAFALDGLPRKPDLAIVGLGANDFLRGFAPEETRRNLDAMLAELKRRDIPVLVTGMMAPRNLDGPYIRSFESIYPDLSKKYGAELDPFFLEGVITRPELLLADGMHPNAAGIGRIAKRLSPRVAGLLKDVPVDQAA